MTKTTKAPLAPGARIAKQVGTAATVFVQRGEAAGSGFRVWVEEGGIADGWEHVYADETIARFEATRVYALLKAHGSTSAIERRTAELAQVVLEAERRRSRNYAYNRDAVDAAVKELDTLDTLADAAMLADIRARLAA